MERPDYIKLFSFPNDYKPPDDSELHKNTKYPNLNSTEYQTMQTDQTPTLYPFFEALAVNSKGKCILASNDIRGRIWDGYLWGFENIIDVGDQEKLCFKYHSNSPITNIQYMRDKIFVLTEASGAVQIWSTQSEAKDVKNYCLFLLGARTEHSGIIYSLDIFPTDISKAITGSSDCSLKIWDTGTGDLHSIHTMNYAHGDTITGISCNSHLECTFATCSSDKSALIWDYRQRRPATGLFDNHQFSFSTIYWSRGEEKQQNILLGDDAGFIYSVDTRVPNKFVDNVKVFDRPVRKIRCNLNQIAVIGNTNLIKVYNWSKTNNYDLIYKDQQSGNLVRDAVWNRYIENELYTIGWDKKIRKHIIK